MISVRAAPAEHYPWIASRAGCVLTAAFRAIEAVRSDGTIVGMVAYSEWTPNAVVMHVAIEHPAALRHLLRAGFEYPFIESGRRIALCAVLSSNARSLVLVRRLGFRETHRIRDGWVEGVDIVSFEMNRSECRWIHPARKAA